MKIRQTKKATSLNVTRQRSPESRVKVKENYFPVREAHSVINHPHSPESEVETRSVSVATGVSCSEGAFDWSATDCDVGLVLDNRPPAGVTVADIAFVTVGVRRELFRGKIGAPDQAGCASGAFGFVSKPDRS